MTKNNKAKKKRPKPLAPPPGMKSRKKARVVTTLFHKYTRELELAQERCDTVRVAELNAKLNDMGGREVYQQASQLSTSFHSTSKWVLGYLDRNGWLYGIRQDQEVDTKKMRQTPRRQTRLLEVGAINTELLDASKQTKRVEKTSKDGRKIGFEDVLKYRLDVRAIDLHPSHEGIEEQDFLTLPIISLDNVQERYDVVVCSMVINCVATPEKRGHMAARLYHQLRPGGLLFLTLPKLCLTQSPYMTPNHFQSLLSKEGAGFELIETKESPKLAFYILRRPLNESSYRESLNARFTVQQRLNYGKKYRNPFAVVLKIDEVTGESLY
jgi:25S rRNA (adenine2142-N1)-methyltransferase